MKAPTFADSTANEKRTKGDATDRAATSQKLWVKTPPNRVATVNNQRTSSAYAGFWNFQMEMNSVFNSASGQQIESQCNS